MKNDQLDDLKKEVLEIKDRYPKLSLDNAFVAWFLRAFIADNEESAVEALKGGSKDKGLDAVFLDHDSRIAFVLQGKYRQAPTPPSEKRSDVIALGDLGRVLLNNDSRGYRVLLQDADTTVREAFEKVRNALHRRDYRLSLQFITTGKVSKTHRDEASQRIDEWDNASYEVFCRPDLIRLMQDYIEGASPPVPTISLPIHGEQMFNYYDRSTNISSWVFTMLGKDLGKLCRNIGDRLFARNIRGFLGNTGINRSIESTLKKEPYYFWYYNNGVTILCDEAKQITERGYKKLLVTNAQIINGQQTTRILALHGDSEATILVKVFVVTRDSKAEQARYGHLVSQIVSATNWQNAISQSDLKSNDIEQVRLERDMRKIGYQYLRKRQTISESKRITGNRYRYFIKKEDMAQFVGACLLDPYEVRLGRNRLFEDDVYSNIFDGRPAAHYLTFYWLSRIVSWFSSGNIRRGYAKWHVINFIWSQIGKFLKRNEMHENFRYVAEREYKYRKQLKPFYSAINDIFGVVLAFYRKNRKTRDGVLDESTFFKHKNLPYRYAKYWESSKNRKRGLVKKKLLLFLKNLEMLDR